MQPEIRYRTDQPLGSEQLRIVWTALEGDLRKALGEPSFELWFADCRLVQVDQNRATISSPGSMYAIWIEENFRDVLKTNLNKYLEGLKGFSIVCCDAETPKEETRRQGDKEIGAGLEGDSQENAGLRPAAGGRKGGKKGKNRRPLTSEELADKARESGLSEYYRFESFVSGGHSALAAAAARSVVENPGSLYQPLFVHGGSGMGKTHLLHAIGWAFLELRHHAEVRYVTAEKFANDYIEAIRHSREMAFRKKYREADLLLIDDVQFLKGKSGFQTEFFHTFNSIADQRNQIVIASDCLASEIPQLEERLVSRMQWGMTVHIEAPDEATRTAILRQKRSQWNLAVDEGVVNWIAARVTKNVRQLEGALIRVSMQASLGKGELTEDVLEETLADLSDRNSGPSLGMEEIKQAVAEHFEVAVKEIEGKRRTARITEARQAAFFLCRELTTHSLKEIALNFGKDHASVVYATKAVKKKSEQSETLRNSLDLLRRRLGQGGGTSRRSEAMSGAHVLPETSREGSDASSGDFGIEREQDLEAFLG